VKLTANEKKKLQEKELDNIAGKLKAGKTLTARESAKLAAANTTDQPQTSGNAAADAGFVTKWEDLAAACSIDRRTLTNVRDRHAAEIKVMGATLTRADGRHVVAAWIAFLDEKGVRGRGMNNPGTTPEDFIDERQLRLRREKLQLDKAEFEFEKAKESMLPIKEFEAALSATVSAFLANINQVPGRASQKIVNRARESMVALMREVLPPAKFAKVEAALDTAAINYGDIQTIIELELEHARRVLAQCKYLEPQTDTAASECPSSPPSPPKPPPSSEESSKPRSRQRRAKPSGDSSKR
jgi:hypothetical protein